MTAGTERPTHWPVIVKDPALFRVPPGRKGAKSGEKADLPVWDMPLPAGFKR